MIVRIRTERFQSYRCEMASITCAMTTAAPTQTVVMHKSPQMAKKLVEVIGVDRVRPHSYTQRDGYTWGQVEKDMHITEWLYAHELCSSLQFTRFLNRDGRELFQVRDGQRVIETNADGTKRIRAVKKH